jgi:hypothetical protein
VCFGSNALGGKLHKARCARAIGFAWALLFFLAMMRLASLQGRLDVAIDWTWVTISFGTKKNIQVIEQELATKAN